MSTDGTRRNHRARRRTTITHPTVLKYDVDANRLVDLYLEGKQARTAEAPKATRRWSFRFPALRLPRLAFPSRRSADIDIPTATVTS